MEKRKKKKVTSELKENRQARELFVEKYPEKHEAFKYLLTTFHLQSLQLKGNCIN